MINHPDVLVLAARERHLRLLLEAERERRNGGLGRPTLGWPAIARRWGVVRETTAAVTTAPAGAQRTLRPACQTGAV